MKATTKLGAAAVLAVAATLSARGSGAVEAAPASAVTVLEMGHPEDYAEGGDGPKMLGFLVSVAADGRPLSLDRVMRLRGTPPRFHTSRDVCRVYHWELRDAGGRVLRGGEFLDRLALYAQQGPENGCVKTVVRNAHTFVLRTPDDPAATHLALEIEAFHGDTVEEGR